MIIGGLQGSIKYLTSHADHAEGSQTKSNEESLATLPSLCCTCYRQPGIRGELSDGLEKRLDGSYRVLVLCAQRGSL